MVLMSDERTPDQALVPDEDLLAQRLRELVDDGVIAVDPNYIEWQSGVYAVVDCVFSAQARYESTVLPMLRERLPGRPGLADGPGLRLSDFTADVDSFGPDKWDEYGREVLNLQVLNGRRKVEVCYDIARFLTLRGLETRSDLRNLGDDGLLDLVLGPLMKEIHGMGPALCRYLLILFGLESQIKPDTMIHRFFDGLSEWTPRFQRIEDIELVQRIIGRIATEMGTTPARLDNAIWLYQSNRPRA